MDVSTLKFTGFALSTDKVFRLYDIQAGKFIEGRDWDNEASALDYKSLLPYSLQDRLTILPATVLTLGEWIGGERVDR